MAILLIRHGETSSNAARIVQTPDTPLNSRGLGQARLLGRRLRQFPVAVVVSSDLARARMTAAELGMPGTVPMEEDALLQERNFGALRGRTYAEIGFDIFRPGYAPPEGESWETFHERAERAFRAVVERAQRCDGDLAVVTHGLVLRSIAERLLALPTGVLAPEQWGNTSLTVIEAVGPHRVSLLNCTAHLDGSEFADGTALSGM